MNPKVYFAEKGKWEAPAASVAAGAVTCSQRACANAEPTSAYYDVPFVVPSNLTGFQDEPKLSKTIQYGAGDPVVSWSRNNVVSLAMRVRWGC